MYFVTSNDNKLKEYQSILGLSLERISLDLPEIQSIDVEAVGKAKAIFAYKKLEHPVFVEDTGLYFEELGGLPGALVKSFLENLSLERICSLVGSNRKAIAKVSIACCLDGKEVSSFIGETHGVVTAVPKGESGFGWDPIFIPDGDIRSFAEISQEEKNSKYMRAAACQKFKQYLLELGK